MSSSSNNSHGIMYPVFSAFGPQAPLAKEAPIDALEGLDASLQNGYKSDSQTQSSYHFSSSSSSVAQAASPVLSTFSSLSASISPTLSTYSISSMSLAPSVSSPNSMLQNENSNPEGMSFLQSAKSQSKDPEILEMIEKFENMEMDTQSNHLQSQTLKDLTKQLDQQMEEYERSHQEREEVEKILEKDPYVALQATKEKLRALVQTPEGVRPNSLSAEILAKLQ